LGLWLKTKEGVRVLLHAPESHAVISELREEHQERYGDVSHALRGLRYNPTTSSIAAGPSQQTKRHEWFGGPESFEKCGVLGNLFRIRPVQDAYSRDCSSRSQLMQITLQ
jgi:hypothetical protein